MNPAFLGVVVERVGLLVAVGALLAAAAGWLWRNTGDRPRRRLGPPILWGKISIGPTWPSVDILGAETGFRLLEATTQEVLIVRQPRIGIFFVGTGLPLLLRVSPGQGVARWEARPPAFLVWWWSGLALSQLGGLIHREGAFRGSAGWLFLAIPAVILVSLLIEIPAALRVARAFGRAAKSAA